MTEPWYRRKTEIRQPWIANLIRHVERQVREEIAEEAEQARETIQVCPPNGVHDRHLV